MPDRPHIHWHKPVAQCGQHLYYECRCGSRRYGITTTTTKRHFPKDECWLAGGPGTPKGE